MPHPAGSKRAIGLCFTLPATSPSTCWLGLLCREQPQISAEESGDAEREAAGSRVKREAQSVEFIPLCPLRVLRRVLLSRQSQMDKREEVSCPFIALKITMNMMIMSYSSSVLGVHPLTIIRGLQSAP